MVVNVPYCSALLRLWIALIYPFFVVFLIWNGLVRIEESEWRPVDCTSIYSFHGSHLRRWTW
jgi:hypothetical protein